MGTIKLGDKVRCRITGFEGIAISRVEYLNGCVQFCVKPPLDKDGKMVDGEYIDSQQLEVIPADTVVVHKKTTGGPQRDTPPTSYRG